MPPIGPEHLLTILIKTPLQRGSSTLSSDLLCFSLRNIKVLTTTTDGSHRRSSHRASSLTPRLLPPSLTLTFCALPAKDQESGDRTGLSGFSHTAPCPLPTLLSDRHPAQMMSRAKRHTSVLHFGGDCSPPFGLIFAVCF